MNSWIRRNVYTAALVVVLGSAVSAQTAVIPKSTTTQTPAAGRLAGFAVVLLVGDLAPGADSLDAVPAGAAQALADVRDLLPFKSYRLLDAQYAAGFTPSSIHLRGLREAPYELSIQSVQVVPGKVGISRFTLIEGADEVSQSRVRAVNNGADPAAAGVRAGEPPSAPASRVVLNTSFGMSLGETVVVGTSGLPGGKALVVLLTARARA